MTIQLTTPVDFKPIARLELMDMEIRERSGTVKLYWEARTTAANGNKVYDVFAQTIKNGKVQKLTIFPAAGKYHDVIALTQDEAVDAPTAFTDILAIDADRVTNNTKAKRLKAVETLALAQGWVDASLTGTVT